jgi:hypothetical protein
MIHAGEEQTELTIVPAVKISGTTLASSNEAVLSFGSVLLVDLFIFFFVLVSAGGVARHLRIVAFVGDMYELGFLRPDDESLSEDAPRGTSNLPGLRPGLWVLVIVAEVVEDLGDSSAGSNGNSPGPAVPCIQVAGREARLAGCRNVPLLDLVGEPVSIAR